MNPRIQNAMRTAWASSILILLKSLFPLRPMEGVLQLLSDEFKLAARIGAKHDLFLRFLEHAELPRAMGAREGGHLCVQGFAARVGVFHSTMIESTGEQKKGSRHTRRQS